MMKDLRSWADRYNSDVDGAFSQYLVGNRTFDESAVDAIERLVDENTCFMDGVVETINGILKDLAYLAVSEGLDEEKNNLIERLEELREDLSNRFGVEDKTPPPPAKAPTSPVNTPSPKTTPSTSEPAAKSNGSKTDQRIEGYDIMAMMGDG